MNRTLLLVVLVTLGCPKKHEDVAPSPEAKPSAAKEIEYPIEALTCRDGVLGKISAPVASASVSAAPVPIASASAIPSGEVGGHGSIGALSGAFGDPTMFAPIGDGGVGFGSGGIGLGTLSGFGIAPRPLVYPIAAMPVDARGPRALAAAKGVCGAMAPLRACHKSSGNPLGAAVFELAIGAQAKVTSAKKESGDAIDDKLLTCVSDALATAAYEPTAAGNTSLRVVFEAPVKPPPTKVGESGVNVAGRLPPEVIRRIIRANFPRIRACYEAGLKRDPTLGGKITMDFVIDNTGAVDKVKVAESTLADAQVKSCITGVFRTLSFPEPEGGIVTVKYPITLSAE